MIIVSSLEMLVYLSSWNAAAAYLNLEFKFSEVTSLYSFTTSSVGRRKTPPYTLSSFPFCGPLVFKSSKLLTSYVVLESDNPFDICKQIRNPVLLSNECTCEKVFQISWFFLIFFLFSFCISFSLDLNQKEPSVHVLGTRGKPYTDDGTTHAYSSPFLVLCCCNFIV